MWCVYVSVYFANKTRAGCLVIWLTIYEIAVNRSLADLEDIAMEIMVYNRCTFMYEKE